MTEEKIFDFDAGEVFDGEEVKLTRPFKMGGSVFRTVKLRIPTGVDYERVTRKDANIDVFGLLTSFTGLPVETLQKMASTDVRALDVTLGKLLWG